MATKEFVKMEIQRVNPENRTEILSTTKDGTPLPLSTMIWAEPEFVYTLRNIVKDVKEIRVLFKDAIKVHELRVPKEYLDENGNL